MIMKSTLAYVAGASMLTLLLTACGESSESNQNVESRAENFPFAKGAWSGVGLVNGVSRKIRKVGDNKYAFWTKSKGKIYDTVPSGTFSIEDIVEGVYLFQQKGFREIQCQVVQTGTQVIEVSKCKAQGGEWYLKWYLPGRYFLEG